MNITKEIAVTAGPVKTIGEIFGEEETAIAKAADSQTYIAWRKTPNGGTLYVEAIRKPGEKGDRYAYTTKADRAAKMTKKQRRDFCVYMRNCGAVGFWA